jgi:hypothetical protein
MARKKKAETTDAVERELSPEELQIQELENELKTKIAEAKAKLKEGAIEKKIDDAITQLQRLRTDPQLVTGISVMVRVRGQKVAKSIASIL